MPKKGATMLTMQTSRFTGFAKGRRAAKGGGSISGKLWNNGNQAIATKPPGRGSLSAGAFQGKSKSRRPQHGGGSVSGKLWNNKNQPVDVNTAGTGTIRASKFKGRIKGSVAGATVRTLGQDFTGFIKTKRPDKGGGSISGQPRNNKGQPIAAKLPGMGTRKAGVFQGNIKTHRPEKGGGSISGKIWNNKNQPIDVNEAGKGTVRGASFKGKMKYDKPEQTAGKPAKYQGDIKGFIPGPKMSNLGQDYEGDYRRKKKGIDNKEVSFFSKVFKGDKKGMLPATHISRDERMATYSDRGKRSIFNRYVQHPKAADASLKKDRHPDGLILNIPIVNQTKRSVNAGHYVHVMKQYWDYKRNPSSNKGALLVREPGKVQAKIANLQGNVKMRKYSDHSLHPDAKFAHSYRDNVKEERTIFMNIKLTWSKLFKKSDNQPRGLKQKPGKPRYDPGEKGLWYD